MPGYEKMLAIAKNLEDVQYGLGHVENDIGLRAMTIEELADRLRELESKHDKHAVDYESIRRCRLLLLVFYADALDARFRAGDIRIAEYLNSLHPIVMELSRIMAETTPEPKG